VILLASSVRVVQSIAATSAGGSAQRNMASH
jgi:hypothetical protein